MVRVWLIRHGQSESNAGLPSTDWRGIPLTELGQRQAARIAGVFADPPQLIVSSPVPAGPADGAADDRPLPRGGLRGMAGPGVLLPRGPSTGSATTSHERAPEVRAYWEQADPQHAEPGAESFAGLLGRVTSFLGRLGAQQAGPVAVFTHGIFMRAVAWHLLTGVADPGDPGGHAPVPPLHQPLPRPQRRGSRAALLPGRIGPVAHRRNDASTCPPAWRRRIPTRDGPCR